MKKFKKAMALSLALAMGLSLVACGDKEKETTTEATTTEATTTEAAATDDATADDASASNAEVALPMPAEDSDPIYVYSWNTELGDRLQYVRISILSMLTSFSMRTLVLAEHLMSTRVLLRTLSLMAETRYLQS